MAPAVDAVAGKYVGRALVAKLDTDRSPETASRFQIRGIPTVIVFDHGREVARQTGAVPQAALEKLLESAPIRAPGADA
jgi:thioredoxin 2